MLTFVLPGEEIDGLNAHQTTAAHLGDPGTAYIRLPAANGGRKRTHNGYDHLVPR
jgi:hypothetical protein